MDIQWTLNCYFELILFLVIQLVPQKLNYAKVPYMYWHFFFFFKLGCIFKTPGKAGKKECHTSHHLKQQCRHINPSMAKHHWRYPGDGIHCLHAVWDWVHQVCWHCLPHSLQIHSPCSGCCLLLLAHFHILHDRQLQEIWPSENQVIENYLNFQDLDLLSCEQQFLLFCSYNTHVHQKKY